jgi:hypothetical protein
MDMSMNVNTLENKVKIVVIGLVSTVLFGGFVIPSVYAETTHFIADFDTSLIPACTTEEVIFSGKVHFDFTEQEGRQVVRMHYSEVHGVGIATGTKYVVHENDRYETIINENGDTMFSTKIHGTFISSGSGDNTKIEITLVNVVHPDGTVTTLVEDAKVTCPG